MKNLFIVFILLLMGFSISAKTPKKTKKGNNSSMHELTINPKYLEKKENQVVYSPDSDRKTDSYTRYIFPRQNYDLKVGRYEVKEGTIFKVKETKKTSKTHTPSNPYEQAPTGGFTYTDIHCEIEKVTFAK